MDISVKERILCEANKVIANKGLNCFTLEEVARKAGVSKGGLLYHYPSKDKLIKALIEYHMEQFECQITSADWLTSFIKEQFNQNTADTNTMAGFLAAIAMDHELLEPVREKRKEWFQNISNMEDPIMAMIICFACYGIAFSNLFGLEALSDDDMKKIEDKLINLSEKC